MERVWACHKCQHELLGLVLSRRHRCLLRDAANLDTEDLGAIGCQVLSGRHNGGLISWNSVGKDDDDLLPSSDRVLLKHFLRSNETWCKEALVGWAWRSEVVLMPRNVLPDIVDDT